jgi:hypothetical protein
MNSIDLVLYASEYKLEKYNSYFCDTLASFYKPIAYSNQCLSGPPEAVYYRIMGMNGSLEELCIQYFYYWDEQICIFSSHRYDYEPIFIYVKENQKKPTMIVNNGFGSVLCGFHKIEIRPQTGIRSKDEQHYDCKMTQSPYYPFGADGEISVEVCYKQYPLDGNDLNFDNSRPLFGIRACSNIFSGASHDLQGFIFDPPLLQLTDDILNTWYHHHNEGEDDMPFSHDIADPFSFPYIRYRRIKTIFQQFASI